MAEWLGLYIASKFIEINKIKNVNIQMDSKNIIKQMNNENNSDIKEY